MIKKSEMIGNRQRTGTGDFKAMGKKLMGGLAALLILFSAGCSDDSPWSQGDVTAPTVSSTNPLNTDTGISINRKVTAIFNEAMAPATFTGATFTLMNGVTPVSVSLAYSERTAVLTPTSNLAANTLYTATITTGVTDVAGNALAANKVWTFTTGATADTTAPIVRSTNPAETAANVVINGNIVATFSEAIDPVTITGTTYTLTQGVTPVPGTVSSAGSVATFDPIGNLTANLVYTARLTTGVKDLAGNALAVDSTWTFTTGTATAAGPAPVNLGTAGNFAILSKSGISTVPNSAITGDLGVSPIAQTAITGFGLALDASGTFSTSPQDTGRVYAADYAPPTPAYMTTAVSDMEIAYTDAAGRTSPNFTELGAGQIGGLTLAPGLYKWGTNVLISTSVTLSGGANDVWIFQIAGSLTQAAATNVTLAGGALPKNIFWQTGSAVDIGTTAHFEGVILSRTSINLQTGSSANTRLLSQTAVSLGQASVTQPAP